MSGYIKLHRKIRNNALLSKNPMARFVFMEILLEAAWRDTEQDWRGQAVKLKRGQALLSRKQLRDLTGLTDQKIRTIVSALTNHQIVKINQPLTSSPCVITICNYETYQDDQPRAYVEPNQTPTRPQPVKEEREEVKKKETTAIAVVGRKAPMAKQMNLPTDLDPELAQIKKAWNHYATETGKPKIKSLTRDRQRRMREVMDENGYTIDDFNEAIEKALLSDYLVEQPWFSFDWLWKEDSNISKVCEGRYGNGRHADDRLSNGMTPKEYQEYVLNGGR